jgi:hypothetical protein
VDGTLAPLSGSPFPFPATDLTISEGDTLLFASDPTHGTNGRIHVLRIDADSGALSPVSGSPFDNDSESRPGGLVSTDRFLFVANGYFDVFSTTTSAYFFDPGTGSLSSVPGSPFDRGVPFPGSPALAIALCPRGSSAPTVCTGDCDQSGDVTVAELVRGVSIALGTLALDQCPAFDENKNGKVEINELILAVTHALAGCPKV